MNDPIGRLEQRQYEHQASSVDKTSLKAFLDYEIRSSWWASLVSWDWMQKITGKYFAWKTKRKYERYSRSKKWELFLKRLQ